MKTLIIFTWSYPYDSAKEDSFIKYELENLLNLFDKIILVPRKNDGELCKYDERIEVDLTFSCHNKLSFFKKINFLFLAFFSLSFYKEIFQNISSVKRVASYNRLITFLGEAFLTYSWTKKRIKSNQIDVNNTLFYTYWISGCTYGLSIAKNKYIDFKYISRAHGIDIYKERWETLYLPLRKSIFSNINGLFLPSKYATEYLMGRYPQFSDIFNIAQLGVKLPNCQNAFSEDGIFRVVSCSFISKVKRLNLLIDSLVILKKIAPNITIEWHHIGGGTGERSIKEYASLKLSNLIDYTFYGTIENIAINNLYKTQPFDLYIILSESEGGIPVALQEAMSYGIPALGTNVGGIPELINKKTGYLISKDATPDFIANEIKNYINTSLEQKNKMKTNTTNKCFSLCNADINFKLFAEELLNIK